MSRSLLVALRDAWRWFVDDPKRGKRPSAFDPLFDCAWCWDDLPLHDAVPLVSPTGALLIESCCQPSCAAAYYGDRHSYSQELAERRATGLRFYSDYLASCVDAYGKAEAARADAADRIADMTGAR